MDRRLALCGVVPLLVAAASLWNPNLPMAPVQNAAELASIAVCLSLFGVGGFSYARGGDRHALLVSTAFLCVAFLDFLSVLGAGPVTGLAAQVALAGTVVAEVRVDTGRPRWWLRREVLLPVALILPPATAGLDRLLTIGSLPFAPWLAASLFAGALALCWRPRVRTRQGSQGWVGALGLFLIAQLLAAGGEGSVWAGVGQLYQLLGLGLVYRSAFVDWVRKDGTDRQTLLRELHHRTKNTLQLIQGLVVLQASEGAGVPEVKELVRKTEDRIQAISLVHHQVDSEDDLSRVRIQAYLEALGARVMKGYRPSRNRISLTADAGDHSLQVDAAIPFGLIVNELLTNSFKHAFPGGARGAIVVRVTPGLPGRLRLEYRDDGVGMGGEVDLQRPESLGLGLIRTMAVQQLGGTVDLTGVGGFSCTVDFPEGSREG